MSEYWYRKVGLTSWVAYSGSQAIWEASTERELLDKLRELGIVASRRPLHIHRVTND